MEYHQKRVIIAYFVGGLQTAAVLESWAAAFSREVKTEVRIGRLLGHGFFQVICKEEAATQIVLMHSPHLLRWGTCMLQPWSPGFKPSKPAGMRMPVWITLKEVPDEYRSNTMEIVAALGAVIGKHRGNATNADQRFCVTIPSGQPWPLTVGVTNPKTGEQSCVCVDYNNLPIRCRYCLSTSHLIKDCHVLYPKKKPKPDCKQEADPTGESRGQPSTPRQAEEERPAGPEEPQSQPVVEQPPATEQQPGAEQQPDTEQPQAQASAERNRPEGKGHQPVGSLASSDSPPQRATPPALTVPQLEHRPDQLT
jgi:hypothetical protein